MKMITITLEGGCWQEIADQMCDYLMRGAKTYESVDEMFADMDQNAARGARIEDLPERTNIAKDCRKCHRESLAELASILKGGYGLGPDEVYDILERMK
jgi:hypothetical protein